MPKSTSVCTPLPIARQSHPLALGLFVLVVALLAPAVAIAQPAAPAAAPHANLPLRNIQIEVRQVQRASRERSAIQAGAGAELAGRGSAEVQARLRLREQQDQQNSTAQQYVLVLNGRSAGIALRSSTPYRLMQTQFRNGVPILVQGTVLLDASTGFVATPRWDGTNVAELELAATQAAPASLRRGGPINPATSSSSSLLVTVGEWVTVAQSDQDSHSSSSAWGAQGAESAHQTSELQVRLTVR